MNDHDAACERAASAPPVRVGIVGFGAIARTVHVPLILATNGLRLQAVASSRPDAVRADLPEVSVHPTPESLFADRSIDVVVIATPNPLHAPLAVAALRAGHHVVVEKPFALDLAEARGVIAAADEAGRLVTVFQNRQFDSDFLGVRRLIADDAVGTVRTIEAHYDRFRPLVRRRWREDPGPGSGLWYDLGPHLVDQVLRLFGVPDRVSADFAVQRDGGRTEDFVHVVAEFGSVRAILHADLLTAGGVPRLVLHGDRGTAVKWAADPQEAQLRAGMRPGDDGWAVDPDPFLVYDGAEGEPLAVPAPDGRWMRYYAMVRDAVVGRGPMPVLPDEALAVMAVLDAVRASAAEGRAVVPEISARAAAPVR